LQGRSDECKIERQKNGKVREREEEEGRRVFLCRRALTVGYVTAYWGAKPKRAKLTTYSNPQVRRLHRISLMPLKPESAENEPLHR
jgi:hypothetical protein